MFGGRSPVRRLHHPSNLRDSAIGRPQQGTKKEKGTPAGAREQCVFFSILCCCISVFSVPGILSVSRGVVSSYLAVVCPR